MAVHTCMRCQARLTADEIALYRKLVCREAERFLCMDCMASDYSVPRKKLEDIVDFYHRTGLCCLFPKYEETEASI